MDSINWMVIELVDEVFDFVGEFGIEGYEFDLGVMVIDFGVDVDGGVEVGMFFVEIQIVGFVMVQMWMGEVVGMFCLYVEFFIDCFVLVLFCLQKVGWEFIFDDFDGFGFGLVCVLVGEEEEFYYFGYYDEFDLMVFVVESIDFLIDEVVEYVVEMIGFELSVVFLLIYVIGLFVGSVMGVVCVVEFVVFNFFEVGYDLMNVFFINGFVLFVFVSYDESVVMGWMNDVVVYGGCVYVIVSEDFDEFDCVIFMVELDYGVLFEQLFEDVDWDFGVVDFDVFGLVQVMVDVVDGLMYIFGEIDEDVFVDLFGL